MKDEPTLSRKERVLMHCAPFNEHRVNDRAMRAAIFKAKKTDEFARQSVFDRAIANLVQSTPIPSEVEEWFAKETMVARPRRTWKTIALNPAVLAIGISLAVIAVFVAQHVIDKMNEFPGADAAKKLLNVASSSRSIILDPVKTEAGTLGDLFFMKHRLAHYDVPAEFADLKTIGCRVFDDEDARRVAQIWLVEKKMQLFLYPADRDPKTGAVKSFDGWRYIDFEGWTGVVQQKNGVCFMAALHGSKKELAPYLKPPEEKAAE